MRYLTLTVVAGLLVGCAAQAPSTASRPPTARVAVASTSSAALAFDPPITLHESAPDLSRDARGQAALVGFEEPSVSSYDVFTYNRQASDHSDYYDQEAFSEKVGTTHR